MGFGCEKNSPVSIHVKSILFTAVLSLKNCRFFCSRGVTHVKQDNPSYYVVRKSQNLGHPFPRLQHAAMNLLGLDQSCSLTRCQSHYWG